jgi:gliding motility-associated-like protein
MNYDESALYTVDVQNFSTVSAIQFLWDFGDGFTSTERELSHTYIDTENHIIKLLAFTVNGCKSETYIPYTAPTLVYVPSAFTPNNDGLNDVLKIEGNAVSKIQMLIYDRWGTKVYEINSLNEHWGGNKQGGEYYLPSGVYNYTIEGINTRGREFSQRGSINIVR